MLKNLLDNKLHILGFVVLIILLAAVRMFEKELFYDPFLDYFKSEFGHKKLPDFDRLWLIMSLLSRYLLNMVISLAMIYVVFKDIELVKFSGILYVLFFIILMVAFFGIIYMSGNENNLMLFYVRRFLIQPLFVILFIPAFYYQNRISKK